MPREKSYSACISGAAALSVAFFIALPFTPARAPGADDADIITPFRVGTRPISSKMSLGLGVTRPPLPHEEKNRACGEVSRNPPRRGRTRAHRQRQDGR